ncbi:hypothetical protein Y032_0500g2577 [Ancylostoma ceylanicum]|uniref:Uncharacterized protein n=1 Tax=Ancylostoma ceylanicum TaxID=53326 RepID=A0A016WU56_9BILA|nr:hypothetical protein Y032_0500g2577 [Ancylostoma ceylanicum]
MAVLQNMQNAVIQNFDISKYNLDIIRSNKDWGSREIMRDERPQHTLNHKQGDTVIACASTCFILLSS